MAGFVSHHGASVSTQPVPPATVMGEAQALPQTYFVSSRRHLKLARYVSLLSRKRMKAQK